MMIDFNTSRGKTKMWARSILYLGLLIIVANACGILYSIVTLFIHVGRGNEEQRKEFRELFGEANIVFLHLGRILRFSIELAQGYFMIKATKLVIKEISSQEANPRT